MPRALLPQGVVPTTGQGEGIFGARKHGFAVGSAAMRHWIESPFSFRLAEKKTAIHGQKKRRLGMS